MQAFDRFQLFLRAGVHRVLLFMWPVHACTPCAAPKGSAIMGKHTYECKRGGVSWLDKIMRTAAWSQQFRACDFCIVLGVGLKNNPLFVQVSRAA